MKKTISILLLAALVAWTVPAISQSDDREAAAYEEGTDAIDEKEWTEAIRHFDSVIAMNGRRADAAWYWKAYAEAKSGKRTDALQSIATLQKKYPQSKWITDAQALEIDIRRDAGSSVSPENVQDEELKLIAIQHLMHTNSERAIPLLEKVLRGNHSQKAKEQALFVLSQSPSPKAAEIIASIARGTAHPGLQEEAIEYLGVAGPRHHKLLEEIYLSSTDRKIKEEILEAFMVGGNRARLFELAKGEKDPHLREEAIEQLGVMGGGNELQTLYRTETSREVKKTIIESMSVGGGAEFVMNIARSEPDLELRSTAVEHLGLMSKERTGAFLVSVYQHESNEDLREAALDALFVQNNATALVNLAKAEKDRRWKREIVEKLSVMNSPEATEYLSSLLD
jgi:HEAT repeat protein